MTKSSTSKKQPLTLHGLLGALSFWGTATRTLLFSFLAAAVYVVALSEATSVTAADNELMELIYVLGSFVLLDFGYVMVARAYPFQQVLDVLALVVADLFLMLLYIAPKVIVSQDIVLRTDPLIYIIFIPLVVLKRDVTVEEVNEVFKKAASEPFYQGILDVTEEELVSSDFKGNSHSAIVDLPLTAVVGGNMLKVVAWYDNEWGYSNRLVELTADISKTV